MQDGLRWARNIYKSTHFIISTIRYNISIKQSHISIISILLYIHYWLTKKVRHFVFNLPWLFYFFLEQGTIFKILGAVEMGRKYHCTPLRSLDCKEFLTGFWCSWHLILQEPWPQFGFPHVFITVLPTEWSFHQVCFTSITSFVCD